MKRLLLFLVVLALFVAACGSSDDVEKSSADVDSAESSSDNTIETKVAATVAAALGQDAPAAPTEPAISGNATPLTPIPQLVEPAAEVSPEVEYAEPGQDGEITFDFGGEATATPVNTGMAPLGGTAFDSTGTMAVTLREAKFVESYTPLNISQPTITPEAGYRLLWLRYEVMNLGPNLNLPEFISMQIMDRDDDIFNCSPYTDFLRFGNAPFVLPGYGQPYEAICQIPVTAAAEELVGLRATAGPYIGSGLLFDLGDPSGVPADFSTWRAAPMTLPVSSTDFCPENTDLPYRLEAARWYDAPDAQPPADVLAAATAWDGNSSDGAWSSNQGGEEQFQRIQAAETPEGRSAVAIQLWQDSWAPYDLTDMDIVAIDIVTTNMGKQANGSPIRGQTFAFFDAGDSLSPFEMVVAGGANLNSPLLMPFNYLNLLMPPGGEQRTTLFAVVPESAERLDFAHLFACSSTNSYGQTDYIVIQVPRQALTPNEPMSAANDQPVTIPEDLQHMVDAGAVQVVVEAGQARTYSGIILEEGRQLTFAYLDGLWRGGPAADWPMVDANGDGRVCRKDTFPDPNGCLMNLIWGVGDADASGTLGVNPIGTSVSTGGELWFGPNDDNFTDNAGSVVVLVQLR